MNQLLSVKKEVALPLKLASSLQSGLFLYWVLIRVYLELSIAAEI